MPFEVSVVIPTFNRADLIGETIESVLAQTLPAAEIIVADDGSKDDTERVVARYAPRVRYTRNENAGAPAARNAGAAIATAPWIAFLDDDDLWVADKLQAHARFAELAPEVPFVFTNFRLVDDGVWSERTKFADAPAEFFQFRQKSLAPGFRVAEEGLVERLFLFQPIFPSSPVMKRSFYDGIGGWDASIGRILSEDLEFMLRAVRQPPIGIIDDALVGIRKHRRNFSGNVTRTLMGEVRILKYAVERHGYPAATLERARERIISGSIDAANGAFSDGNFEALGQCLQDIPFGRRDPKLHLKSAIRYLPGGLGRRVAKALVSRTGH